MPPSSSVRTEAAGSRHGAVRHCIPRLDAIGAPLVGPSVTRRAHASPSSRRRGHWPHRSRSGCATCAGPRPGQRGKARGRPEPAECSEVRAHWRERGGPGQRGPQRPGQWSGCSSSPTARSRGAHGDLWQGPQHGQEEILRPDRGEVTRLSCRKCQKVARAGAVLGRAARGGAPSATRPAKARGSLVLSAGRARPRRGPRPVQDCLGVGDAGGDHDVSPGRPTSASPSRVKCASPAMIVKRSSWPGWMCSVITPRHAAPVETHHAPSASSVSASIRSTRRRRVEEGGSWSWGVAAADSYGRVRPAWPRPLAPSEPEDPLATMLRWISAARPRWSPSARRRSGLQLVDGVVRAPRAAQGAPRRSRGALEDLGVHPRCPWPAPWCVGGSRTRTSCCTRRAPRSDGPFKASVRERSR